MTFILIDLEVLWKSILFNLDPHTNEDVFESRNIFKGHENTMEKLFFPSPYHTWNFQYFDFYVFLAGDPFEPFFVRMKLNFGDDPQHLSKMGIAHYYRG